MHQLTALSGALDLRHFDRDFALTNRLRTEGTDHLLAAGRAVGRRALRRPELRRLAVRPHRRPGQDRGRPARPDARRARCATTLDAIRHLEEAVTGADWTEGVVLRYGGFYGPGTSLGPTGGEHGRADPQAQVPGRRRRRRRLVVRPHRGRRRRHGRGGRARRARHLQRRRRRARAGRASGCRRWRARSGAQAAAARAALARPAARRRGGDGHDDRGARRVEREGQARARLAAAATRAGARASRRGRVTEPHERAARGAAAARRSRSPTGCSAA